MTNYPYGFDNNITLPGVSGASQEDAAITALREATFAIEIELGITPSGIYPDVRTRLDILESRINLSVPPTIFNNDGYVKSPLFIWNFPQNIILTISDGYGAPTEDRLNGSLYMRSNGTANNELYIRRSGAWYPIQTDLWVANCDLAGTYLCQEVIGIRNNSLNVSLETIGSVEDGYHLTWNDSGKYWEAQTGFIPGHDLMAFSGPYGRTGQTVIGLQGYPLSGVAPTDGYVLVWSTSDNRWEPQSRAVIFDGYVSRVNLRSNRANQSPILNTQTGIVNLSTDTGGLSNGTTGNYSTILGGDRNDALGTHSLVVAGFANSAQDGYSLVVTGNANTATAANSTVVNGVSNTASGATSFIGNGSDLTAAGDYSTVLNGHLNSISAGSTHAAIISGHDNQIVGGIGSEHSIILGGDTNIVNNANNVLLGMPTSSSSLGDFSVLLSGVSNSIAALSDYAVILSGISNASNGSSEFSLIGTGNNNLVTLHYATILNGSSSTVNALYGSILNGNANSVTGDYSTIINGTNNSVSTVNGYGIILDGYNNTISGEGGFIADGYHNTISGLFSSIINGNFNTISGRNSTILNGANNNIDASSSESTVIVGENNIFTNSANTTVAGSSNTFTNASQTFVIGTLNSIQSTASFINGSNNTLSSGTSFNRMFGSNNIVNSGASTCFMVGNSNQLVNSSTNDIILGSTNILDAATNSIVIGSNNIANANYSSVMGQYGKSRMFGQNVQANSRFTAGKIGEVQWSRVILSGSSLNGTAISLQLQDSVPTNPFFVDGYSYDFSIKVLIVYTNPIVTGALNPTGVVPARYYIDVLAHQESGTLHLDNINYSLSTPNTSDSPTRTPWTVNITNSGNQLVITVDAETPTSYVQPGNTPSDRRAVATIDMREISRL